MSIIQQALLPSIKDPRLFMVKTKVFISFHFKITFHKFFRRIHSDQIKFPQQNTTRYERNEKFKKVVELNLKSMFLFVFVFLCSRAVNEKLLLV
jgi:hypothetical protein